jgi:hypothetical protein
MNLLPGGTCARWYLDEARHEFELGRIPRSLR